jgi:hypothetical protein
MLLLQERASKGKAEHSLGRIEVNRIKIATNLTGDLLKRKEDRELDRTRVVQTVAP